MTTHGDAAGSSASSAAAAPDLKNDDVKAVSDARSAAAGPSSGKSDKSSGTALELTPNSDTQASTAPPTSVHPSNHQGDSAPVRPPGTDPEPTAPKPAPTEPATPEGDPVEPEATAAESVDPVAPPAAPEPHVTAPDEPAEERVAAAEEPVAAAEERVAAAEEPVTVVAEEPPVEPFGTTSDAAVLEAPKFAEAPPAVGELATALAQLRSAIDETAYPLVMPSAQEAQRVGTALVSQLDDYLLPRLARLDAPLLVVVGGSTGAGKSTLVNSLVRAPVSAAGVLRPTTRSPVLVSHSSDLPWFRKGELLPGLTRSSDSSADPNTLQLVAAPALGPGLAFLDAPDIDSVVDRNRALATQLLAAADLWLFVTTAARYADAVPWELLTTARLRGTVIALVLDRVPPEAAGEISAHLGEMLAAHDMSAAPLFVLPETRLDSQGLLSEDDVKPLHDWFAHLAADSSARAAVVRQTLDGALAALRPAVDGLADAADDQARAGSSLDERVTAAYRTAKRTVEEGLQDGRLLRGEVLARWQEFVGTGEFLRSLENRVGHLRDKLVSAVTGRPAPGRNLQTALESQLVTLLRGVSADAAEQAYSAWQAHPAGAALLEPALQHPAADLAQRADRLVRDWQQWVLDLVRSEAGDKRFVARGAAYAVNGVGIAVMIAVFTSTAFIPTGLEVAVGAGTTVAAQKVLEAIFGDQAIRTLATRAREDLLARVNVLLDSEAARFTERTAAVGLDTDPGARLRKAADDVERARQELTLLMASLRSAGAAPREAVVGATGFRAGKSARPETGVPDNDGSSA